jgi:prolipoprotein diacylglyceryltransferase
MLDRQAYWSFAIVVVVAILAAVVAVLWASSGDSQVTLEGEAALALGVIITVLLGGGLMTVVFLSNRTGQDR